MTHRSDPGLDHLHGCMLTACSVCGGWHSHRCDLPFEAELPADRHDEIPTVVMDEFDPGSGE